MNYVTSSTNFVGQPTTNLQITDNGYEPPISKDWRNNMGLLHLEGLSKSPDFNPSNCIITSQTGFTGINTYNVRRLAVTRFSFTDVIPTIVDKNNLVDFTVDAVDYQAVLPIGFYQVPGFGANTFLDALVTALTNASGQVFSITPVVVNKFQSVYGGGLYYNLTCAGHVFSFPKTRNNLRLVPVFGPNFESLETETKVVGPLLLLQTRFFDVRSNTLTQDEKISSKSNLYGSTSSIFRVNLKTIYDSDRTEFGAPGDGPFKGNSVVVDAVVPRFINCNPNRQLTSVDIRLVDEFGEILTTLPPISNGNGYPLKYTIEIIMEPN